MCHERCDEIWLALSAGVEGQIMMSSNGFRSFDDLPEQYEDEWFPFGLEDDGLKCTSPIPGNGPVDMGLHVPMRTCPSPLPQIPTRDPMFSEIPPKLSPAASEPQTFITLSTHIPTTSAHDQAIPAASEAATSSDLADIEYEVYGMDIMQPRMATQQQLLLSKNHNDIQMQPSTSRLPAAGSTVTQQSVGCIQTVSGQWFVQTPMQHVQTSVGTVIAVLPNFCRNSTVNSQNLSTSSEQQHIVTTHAVLPSSSTLSSAISTPSQQQIQSSAQQQRHVRSSGPLQMGVTANAPLGASVMQQLLSQPTIARQQISSAVQNQNVSNPSSKPKQRTIQSRANGRKKKNNASQQGGTLGAVLAKANKLAAASSTDASMNQILPPSQGIEMRLSIQNSEQVANLSKEISRLQSLQAAYRVDHSGEIKELENQRAQIFFEALAQQHKDKDLLSAVNPQLPAAYSSQQRNTFPVPSSASSAPSTSVAIVTASRHQRHSQQQQQSSSCFTLHHMQPSTSFEHAPAYDSPKNVQPSSYPQVQQFSSQSTVQTSIQSTVNGGAVDHRLSATSMVQIRPAFSRHFSYATTVNQVQPGEQMQQQHIESFDNVPQGTTMVVVQSSPCRTPVVTSEQISSPAVVPAPQIPTSAEISASVEAKKQDRSKRLSKYFEQLCSFLESADISSPFRDFSDMLQRLLPYHIFHEPDLSKSFLGELDHQCLKRFVYLNERKFRIEKRLRSILYRESMEAGSESVDCCTLLSMENEYEKRKLEEERRVAKCDLESFVSTSSICNTINREDLEERKRLFEMRTVKGKPLLHFEYHPFSETEVLEREITSFFEEESVRSLSSSSSVPKCEESNIDSEPDDNYVGGSKTVGDGEEDDEDGDDEEDDDDDDDYENEDDERSKCEFAGFQTTECVPNPASPNGTDSADHSCLEVTANCNKANSICSTPSPELSSSFCPFTKTSPAEAECSRTLTRTDNYCRAEQDEIESATSVATTLTAGESGYIGSSSDNKIESDAGCIDKLPPSRIERRLTGIGLSYHIKSSLSHTKDIDGLESIKDEQDRSPNNRPPLRIRIALPASEFRELEAGRDHRQRKKRKKKKRKRKHDEGNNNEYVSTKSNSEVNGYLPSCSKSLVDTPELVAATLDDPSHKRILMRITLNKNKLVPAQKSLSLSCPIAECSASSTAVSSPESNVVETSVLPPQKIPKLTIRFGGPKVDPMLIQSSSKQRLSPSFPPQNHVVMKSFQCGNSVLSPQLSVSSYNCTEDIDDVEAATSVQFSPESERSTEDDTEQLRAQTDDALSRLNSSGWDSNDSKLPLRNPADVFSRLVGSSPLMNPLIEFSSVRSLIPPLPPASSWVLDTSRAETRTATSTVIAPPWCPLLSKSTTLIRQATTVQSSNRSATSRSSQYDGSPASN